jgi:dTMP kinase
MSRVDQSASGGIWVSFEGIEGTGKTTQIERLAAALRDRGADPLRTREPGGTDLGRRLRELLLAPTAAPMDPTAELLLYVADRAQHLSEIVLPALARGRVVLCDRGVDATVAYQGYGRELGAERVLALHRQPPLDARPHRTILLDIDAEEGLYRARKRNVEQGLDRTEGRFEEEALAFHRRVRAGYLELASAAPDRFRVVDARGDEPTVADRVRAALGDLLNDECAS